MPDTDPDIGPDAGPGPAPAEGPPILVADIGATNARFGLIHGRAIADSRVFRCADFASLEAAAEAYLAAAALAERPALGAFAIAGPVTGDRVAMTNHPWVFSVAAARAALGLERLKVINDFTATALSIPRLTDADRAAVGAGAPVPGMPIGVLGPGSGLGVSGLVPAADGWIALSGEGGHVTMAPADDRESAILAWLRQEFDHVSAERALSGPGLVNLYRAITALDGRQPAPLTPEQVAAAGLDGADPACREALETFCAMLGAVAGNLALTLGARGGVYVAGGIPPRLGPFLAQSRFRERFEGKGRMRAYLAPIPTWVVTHDLPAFLGLAEALARP